MCQGGGFTIFPPDLESGISVTLDGTKAGSQQIVDKWAYGVTTALALTKPCLAMGCADLLNGGRGVTR